MDLSLLEQLAGLARSIGGLAAEFYAYEKQNLLNREYLLLSLHLVIAIVLLALLSIVLKYGGTGLGKGGALVLEFLKGVLVNILSQVQRGVSALADLLSPEVADKESDNYLRRAAFRKYLDAVMYLVSGRNWRYRMPWYLVIGDNGSGKSTLLKSASKRSRPATRVEERLPSDQTSWAFLERGILIEVDDPEHYDETVDLLRNYRPERAADGLIVTIPLELLTDEPERKDVARRDFGLQLFNQLQTFQKLTRFTVPVYVLVTRCDKVPGYDALFNSLYRLQGGRKKQDEMLGWSNPERREVAYRSRWSLEAVAEIVQATRRLQLSLSGHADSIESKELDQLLLLDLELQKLGEPLQQIMDVAFESSAYQESPMLRGIWFVGRRQEQIDHLEDFLDYKLWPEANLAYPIESRTLAIEPRIRRLQVAISFSGLLVFGLMIWDFARLASYETRAKVLWEDAAKSASYCSAYGNGEWSTLRKLTQLGDQPLTLSLPYSWFGGQLPEMIQESRSLYTRLLAGMTCRMKVKGDDLVALVGTQARDIDDDLLKLESAQVGRGGVTDELITRVNLVAEFEKNRERLQTFINDDTQSEPVENLERLMAYLYLNPKPAEVDLSGPLLAPALSELRALPCEVETPAATGDTKQDAAEDPPANSRRDGETVKGVWACDITRLVPNDQLAKGLEELASQVSVTLEEAAMQVPVTAIGNIIEGHAYTDNIDVFSSWYSYVGERWVNKAESGTPCTRINEEITSARNTLANSFNLNLTMIGEAVCQNIVDRMAARKYRGYRLFDTQEGALEKNPALDQLYLQMKDLKTWVSVLELPPSDALAPGKGQEIRRWNNKPLIEAKRMLLTYQAFRHRYWYRDESLVPPIYSAALTKQVEARLDDFKRDAMETIDPEKTSAVDPLMSLEISTGSFTQASGHIADVIELSESLLFDKDHRFRRRTEEFVDHQFMQLRLATASIYEGADIRNPGYNRAFTDVLFGQDSDFGINNYLKSQRLTLMNLADSYAAPLVGFLIEQSQLEEGTEALLWSNTMREIDDYRRKLPNSSLTEIEAFISGPLREYSPATCTGWLQRKPFRDTSGGLVSQRHQHLDAETFGYCTQQIAGSVEREYIELVRRFEEVFQHRYPFEAPAHKGPLKPGEFVSEQNFVAFFNHFKEAHGGDNGLIARLKSLAPEDRPANYLAVMSFVSDLDEFSTFMTAVSQGTEMQVPLQVDFAYDPKDSRGGDQIIRWTFSSGPADIFFPNGGAKITWGPGDTLGLSLTWSGDSAYAPVKTDRTSAIIDPASRSAHFGSLYRHWSLFEWLQHGARDQFGTVLSFEVDVASAGSARKAPLSSYTSRVKLRLRYLDHATNELRPLPVGFPNAVPHWNMELRHANAKN